MQALTMDRYEIRRELGRGGAGVVYEALDTRTQAVVALKTITTRDGETLYQLKHEFRLLAEVQHRNLVRLGELLCEGDRWFFTMQLVQGRPWLDYVRGGESGDGKRPGPAFDEARLRAALIQIVQALSALHDAGYVHCDVKPSNILVSNDGHVVLLDFGMSQLVRHAASVGVSLGTPSYVAPEVIEAAVAQPAADMYSLGVMLYQALTGDLPFSGKDFEVMEAKMLRAPPSPSVLAPDAPADLLALCEDLLQSDPGQRPGVGEVLQRLGEAAVAADELYAGMDTDGKAPFIGRSAELAALHRAFAAVGDGQSRSVVVEGEPGVGKSMMAKHFLASLGPEVLLLSGRCYEQESVPFKGIDSIVDALTDHLCTLYDDEVHELLAGGVRYLSGLFPVLTRVDAVCELVPEAARVISEGALRELAMGELGRLLDALARRAPLVLFIDDLQWADDDGLDLLGRILLRPERAPGLFIATSRPVADPGPELSAVLDASNRITLAVFTAEEAQALWSALNPAQAGEPAMNERALREAAGHPLFLVLFQAIAVKASMGSAVMIVVEISTKDSSQVSVAG